MLFVTENKEKRSKKIIAKLIESGGKPFIHRAELLGSRHIEKVVIIGAKLANVSTGFTQAV